MTNKLRFSALVLAAAASFAGDVDAATTSGCTVTSINYLQNRFNIQCSGVASLHHAVGPGGSTTCPAVTIDTLKVWESMAQAALLSGKKLNITYDTPTTCTLGNATLAGQRVITAVQLY